MKKAFAILMLATILGGCAKKANNPPPPPPPNKDFQITLTWNEDFTNVPKCSSTVTKGCVSGFTVGYMAGTTTVVTPLPNPNVPLTACTGSAEPETCKYITNSQLPIGDIIWSATAVGIDNDGNPVTATSRSAAATKVSIPSPTNVNATISELVPFVTHKVSVR